MLYAQVKLQLKDIAHPHMAVLGIIKIAAIAKDTDTSSVYGAKYI